MAYLAADDDDGNNEEDPDRIGRDVDDAVGWALRDSPACGISGIVQN